MTSLPVYQKNLIALKGIIEYELKRVLRIWRQTLIPPLINMTLFFVVFGKFIGSRIPEISGYPYIAFLTPGIIMMVIIMESYNGSVFPFFMSKFHRSVEEILVSPVPNAIIILGYTLSGMLRGLLTGTIITLISLVFNPFIPKHPGIMILTALLSTALFSLAGFLNAIFAKNFEDTSVIPTFILTPLVYLGGVFYSVQQLPPFWQKISLFNPIVYIIKSFRYGFLGIHSEYLTAGFTVLIVLILSLFSLNLYFLNDRLKT